METEEELEEKLNKIVQKLRKSSRGRGAMANS